MISFQSAQSNRLPKSWCWNKNKEPTGKAGKRWNNVFQQQLVLRFNSSGSENYPEASLLESNEVCSRKDSPLTLPRKEKLYKLSGLDA